VHTPACDSRMTRQIASQGIPADAQNWCIWPLAPRQTSRLAIRSESAIRTNRTYRTVCQGLVTTPLPIVVASGLTAVAGACPDSRGWALIAGLVT
jgi:hypothetical protein